MGLHGNSRGVHLHRWDARVPVQRRLSSGAHVRAPRHDLARHSQPNQGQRRAPGLRQSQPRVVVAVGVQPSARPPDVQLGRWHGPVLDRHLAGGSFLHLHGPCPDRSRFLGLQGSHGEWLCPRLRARGGVRDGVWLHWGVRKHAGQLRVRGCVQRVGPQRR